mgnify:CR=1 FL=1
MRILFAEDDRDLNNAVKTLLTRSGYQVDAVFDGEEALDYVRAESYDGMILDWMMPEMDGISVLRRMRTEGIKTPCLLLTARDAFEDRVTGLDAGADDYLIKPFSVDELLARLRATVRRLNQMQSDSQETSEMINGPLRIDYAAGCAFLSEKELRLTPIEYKLLCVLARNCGKVLTHKFITQQVWGTAWENNVASLRVFMATLRKKLESDPANPKLIRTVWGKGYQFG